MGPRTWHAQTGEASDLIQTGGVVLAGVRMALVDVHLAAGPGIAFQTLAVEGTVRVHALPRVLARVAVGWKTQAPVTGTRGVARRGLRQCPSATAPGRGSRFLVSKRISPYDEGRLDSPASLLFSRPDCHEVGLQSKNQAQNAIYFSSRKRIRDRAEGLAVKRGHAAGEICACVQHALGVKCASV